jgi:hypothetical protein
VDYGWQIIDKKVTAVESGGPSSTAFIKVASTKESKNRFRNKGFYALKTDIIAQNEFPPLNLKCYISKFCAKYALIGIPQLSKDLRIGATPLLNKT